MVEQQALNELRLQTIIMKTQLNPNLKLTLSDKCLRKVIVYLLNSNEMLSKIENYKYPQGLYYRSHWQNNVEMEVKSNVSKLPLPEALKKEIMAVVKPASFEILRWKLFHESFIHEDKKYFNKMILKELQWTCEGAIDHRRTAQALLRLDAFDLEKRYKLACLYCLEEDIKLLWEQLPEKRKWYYHGGHDTSRVRELQLEFYWPYVLLGEESQLPAVNSSFNKHALVCSGRDGNKTVSEYFFRKLTAEERDSALLSALDAAMYRNGRKVLNWPEAHVQVGLGDVACYFLSLLSPEQQIRLLRENPCAILNLLYDWPWHEVFLEIMDVVWTFLPQDQYGTLMDALRHAGYYFPNLFQKVFIGSPVLFRNYFVDREIRHWQTFCEFFIAHDIETVKVIFENINHGDVISLLTSEVVVQFFDSWVTNNESLDMIELCFQVASLSETDRKTLRAVYVGFLDSLGDSPCALMVKESWEPVFTFLGNAASCNKRISEDETSAEVKKLCTEEEKNDTEK